MVLDLENLDATILQFDPDFKVEMIRPKAFRPPKDWSNRGQMTRIVLSIMRQAAEPLTSRDVALELLVERALDKNDQRLLRLMTKRVGVALREQKNSEMTWREDNRRKSNGELYLTAVNAALIRRVSCWSPL